MQVFGDDGTRIDVRVDGADGTAVVLIHGFPVTREIWNAQVDALARTHRVIAPDLRGMGASGISDGPYLIESLAADIAIILDTLGIERAAVVGHSLGGYVTLAFARMFAERVSHLALVCSRLAADTAQTARARNDLADLIEREDSIEPAIAQYVPRLFAPATLQSRPDLVESVERLARRLRPKGAAAILRGMALRAPADDIAPDLDVPMLMLAGGADAVITVQEARAIAQAFPQGRLVVCERSGHLPMLEEPEAVTATLEALLT